jgi:uncharacterized protein YbjQ (UPF0145 family)
MAEIRASGTWGSALSTDEFAAIKSVGFEPVGQVLGAAVYNLGYRGGYGCPSYGSFGSFSRLQPLWQPGATAVSSSGQTSTYAPLVQTMYAARRAALGRMSAECAQLGGHGVVGVLLTMGRFAGGGLEFKAIGTAVRAPGGMPLSQPFTSDVSGQDFAKLIMDGAVPVSLALGISIGARHDDWLTMGQSRWTTGNTEVTGYTDLVNRTRHDARNELQRDVLQMGGEGVVIQRMDMRVSEHECPVQEGRRDHVVEVTIVGTAITHFAKPRRAAERPSLAVLSLDPQRRQAARIRLGGGTGGVPGVH